MEIQRNKDSRPSGRHSPGSLQRRSQTTPRGRQRGAAERHSATRAAARGETAQAPRACSAAHYKNEVKATDSAQRGKEPARGTSTLNHIRNRGSRDKSQRRTGSKPACKNSKFKGARAEAKAESQSRHQKSERHREEGGRQRGATQPARQGVAGKERTTSHKHSPQQPRPSHTLQAPPPLEVRQSEARAEQHTSPQLATGSPRHKRSGGHEKGHRGGEKASPKQKASKQARNEVQRVKSSERGNSQIVLSTQTPKERGSERVRQSVEAQQQVGMRTHNQIADRSRPSIHRRLREA